MKQLSLVNFGVQELDAREMVEIDGGTWEWFGKNYIGSKGWYTINLLGIPIALFKEF